MGFAPAEDPKLALLVVIDEPQGGNYGGVVAAPIFKVIMERVLSCLQVVPKGTMVVKNKLNSAPGKERPGAQPLIKGIKVGKGAVTIVMPDLSGLSMRNALSRMEGRGLIIKVSGNGKVVGQAPRPGTVIERGDICYLKFRSPS
jgi:cell division protein FtsI (penicillin-binding protein 3)